MTLRTIHTVVRVIGVAASFATAGAAEAHGQQIRGRVYDADARTPISAADVSLLAEDGRVIARAVTNTEGRFIFDLRQAGVWHLRVSHLAYQDPEPVRIEVDEVEAVDVEVQLARSTIPLDAIVVTGRSQDIRHARSYVAALARRTMLPTAGGRRVLVQSDPELRTAMRVTDIFQWLPPPLTCVSLFIDGKATAVEAIDPYLESSASQYAAVEFYRRMSDAPREYRRFPIGKSGLTIYCSVIALWTR